MAFDPRPIRSSKMFFCALAALGFTGVGQANTKALSINSVQMKCEMILYADNQANRFDTIHKGGAAATAVTEAAGAKSRPSRRWPV